MKDLKHISKFLSLVLRHQPQEIGISMDDNGWVDVDELIEKSGNKGLGLDFETLEQVVNASDKQRFAFNEDQSRIRANQGHSIEVDMQFEPVTPPEFLYHGTVSRFIADIRAAGLQKMQRQYVHLSSDTETAHKVGSRRGNPIILKIHAGRMHHYGHKFFLSQNGVWLCDFIPTTFIEFDKQPFNV